MSRAIRKKNTGSMFARDARVTDPTVQVNVETRLVYTGATPVLRKKGQEVPKVSLPKAPIIPEQSVVDRDSGVIDVKKLVGYQLDQLLGLKAES
jgi:hypothetical protein